MEQLLQTINEACTAYYNGELDDAGFLQVMDQIPAEVWQNQDSALQIVTELVENEDLYEVSLEKNSLFAEFICSLLPQTFRENRDYILATADIIADFMTENCDGASCFDLEKVFESMPHTPWEDDQFATAAANLVIDRAYSLFDLNCISEVIPDSVWKNENELVWLVRRIYNADERNMNQLSLFPDQCWESAQVILEILSCLQSAIENDREWGTAYGNFRGKNEDYLADFLAYVPEKFKSDKDFIQELLENDYFCDGFGAVYEWIDQSLWLDKEFVLSALNADENAVTKVPEQLIADAEFCDEIQEIVDFGWLKSFVPVSKQPQWLRDWIK